MTITHPIIRFSTIYYTQRVTGGDLVTSFQVNDIHIDITP